MKTRRSFIVGSLTHTVGASAVLGYPLSRAFAFKRDKPIKPEKDPALLVAEDLGPAGPVVGHTSADAALVWMYTPLNTRVSATATPAQGGPTLRADIDPIRTDDLEVRGNAWRVAFNNLKPGTAYQYQVTLDANAAPQHQGTFTTAPQTGKPCRFRLGVTSCMKFNQPQSSWPNFLRDKPDLHLTLGDTIYGDTTDPRLQLRQHLRYRRMKEFAQVARSMPNYAVWDDHDFGPDNSDMNAKGKEGSLAGWQRYWLNPPVGTRGTPGAFFKLPWGDVDFFVCDGRYHRSPAKAPDDENKTMLGDAQFNWLTAGLKNSTARFKIIAFGSTLHHSKNDGWRLYTHQRHQLFDAIKSLGINGVACLSGSLHNSLTWEHHESDRVGYPLVEVISSGIANGKSLSYATLDFDTTLDDPTINIRIINKAGKEKDNKTWKLSQLSHA
jgi:alkaline phosphatase D